MAKGTKPVKSKVKTEKQKLWDKRKDYHSNVPDSQRNPDHKEDFDKVLKALFPPVEMKANKSKVLHEAHAGTKKKKK